MVRTLIRHEYHRTRKQFGILIGLATLGVVLAFLLSSTAWPVIANMSAVLGFLITGAFLVVLVLGLAVDVYRSGFSRQGYLTHALPVPGPTILWTKLGWASLLMISGLVWFGGALLVSMMSMQLAAGSPVAEVWSQMRTTLGDVLAGTPTWLWVCGILVIVSMALCYVVQVYFAVSVGSEKRFHRMQAGGPVLLYALVYLVMQLVMLLGIALVPVGLVLAGELRLVTFDLATLFGNAGNAGSEVMPLGFLPALLLLTVVLLWRTVVSWRRKVALR